MTCWDHPRVCGEQCQRPRSIFPSSGSPPRVRGTVTAFRNSPDIKGSPPRVRGTGTPGFTPIFLSRITPACAGNRTRVIAFVAHIQDHPRVCGEQSSTTRRWSPGRGSPPRVRGTATGGNGMHSHRRITPACAGNSYFFHHRRQNL